MAIASGHGKATARSAKSGSFVVRSAEGSKGQTRVVRDQDVHRALNQVRRAKARRSR